MRLKKPQLDYKWVILGVCILMEFVCLGFCSSNVGLYTKAVTEALNIKRSVYSLTNSIRYIVQVITALYFGALINRFGVRKMASFGMLALTGSVAIRAAATQFWHLYIGGALWGIGIVFCGGTMAGTIVRRWFKQDIGRYTGIVMSANGIGGAIAAQIITPLINNGETFGYRKAYLLSAILSLAISIVVIICLKEHPKDGPATQPTGKKQPKGNVWSGLSYDVIKKKPYFYATAALVFLTGISLQSVGSISVVYLTDLGLPSGYIATSATVSSLCLTFTKVLIGMTYDKKGLRFTLLMCISCAITGFLIKVTLVNVLLSGMIFAMVASVLATVATPLETVMIPLLTGDLFGSASYNKVLGIFMAMNSLGLCLGSPLGDLYYDIFGTYKPCFWFFAALLAVVAVGYIFVIRAAKKDQAAISA